MIKVWNNNVVSVIINNNQRMVDKLLTSKAQKRKPNPKAKLEDNFHLCFYILLQL